MSLSQPRKIRANNCHYSRVKKTKGPVIDSQAENAHVVSVEDAVTESDRLPLGHSLSCSQANLQDTTQAQPFSIR